MFKDNFGHFNKLFTRELSSNMTTIVCIYSILLEFFIPTSIPGFLQA